MDLQRLTIGQMAQLNHILQSARIDLIQNMKRYGLTLKQIKDMLENDDADVIRQKLEKQSKDIEDRLQQLTRVKSSLNRVLDNYKRYEALPKNEQIFLEYQSERQIYSCECEQDFFEQDEAGYEYMLRQLKQHLVSHDIPLSLFCNIGTIIRKENLKLGRLTSKEVFLFVDERMDIKDCEKVPSATSVCMCSGYFITELSTKIVLTLY